MTFLPIEAFPFTRTSLKRGRWHCGNWRPAKQKRWWGRAGRRAGGGRGPAATFLPLVEVPRTPALLGGLWALQEGEEAEARVNPFPGWEFLLPLAESFGPTLPA